MTGVFIFTGLVFLISLFLLLANHVLLRHDRCRVQVVAGDGSEQLLEVEGGRTLLDILSEAGYRIPSSCGGQGSCGFCRVHLLDPPGKPYVTELPFLSLEEIAGGIRLACRYKVVRDCRVRILDPLDMVRHLVEQGRFDRTRRWRVSIG